MIEIELLIMTFQNMDDDSSVIDYEKAGTPLPSQRKNETKPQSPLQIKGFYIWRLNKLFKSVDTA